MIQKSSLKVKCYLEAYIYWRLKIKPSGMERLQFCGETYQCINAEEEFKRFSIFADTVLTRDLTCPRCCYYQKQPPRGVFKKRSSKNMCPSSPLPADFCRCILTSRTLKLILYDISSNFILNMWSVKFF